MSLLITSCIGPFISDDNLALYFSVSSSLWVNVEHPTSNEYNTKSFKEIFQLRALLSVCSSQVSHTNHNCSKTIWMGEWTIPTSYPAGRNTLGTRLGPFPPPQTFELGIFICTAGKSTPNSGKWRSAIYCKMWKI